MNDLLNVSLAVIEGIGVVLSPCILPILPFILAGSILSSRQQSVGTVCGFVVFFSLLLLCSHWIMHSLNINGHILHIISYINLLLFGIIMMIPYLSEKFTSLTSRFNIDFNFDYIQNHFIRGLLFGGSLGLLWTPCAGPILGTVITQAVMQTTNCMTGLLIAGFSLGAAIPMLLIIIYGNKLLSKIGWIKQNSVYIKQVLGFIIICNAIYGLI